MCESQWVEVRGLGHHVAELAPKRLPLARGERETGPSCVCQRHQKSGNGDTKVT